MIYFIACPELAAVKIGVTFNPPYHRLMVVQSHCPLELVLIGVQEGDHADEKTLLARFAADRIRGEWFRLSDDLRAHIAQFPAPERRTRQNWRRLKAAA